MMMKRVIIIVKVGEVLEVLCHKNNTILSQAGFTFITQYFVVCFCTGLHLFNKVKPGFQKRASLRRQEEILKN